MLIFHHLFLGPDCRNDSQQCFFQINEQYSTVGIGAAISRIFLTNRLDIFFSAESINDGRIYAHSLTIAVILIIIGLTIWVSEPRTDPASL